MFSIMLSNWTTLRAPSTSATTIKQPESQWLDVADYEDLVGWLEVREFSNGGGTLTWAYQLSPTKDDIYFAAAAPASPFAFAVSATGVTVSRLVLGATSPNVAYNARYLRYQLSISSAVAWDITFRCWISANVGARRKHSRPRCVCGRVLELSLGRCGCGRFLRSAP